MYTKADAPWPCRHCNNTDIQRSRDLEELQRRQGDVGLAITLAAARAGASPTQRMIRCLPQKRSGHLKHNSDLSSALGPGSEVSNSANEVRSSSSNRRRPDSVSSSGSCWLPGMEYLSDGQFRVLDPRAVLAIVLFCFELLQETETRRSGRMS
jgi:hypothetical protein